MKLSIQLMKSFLETIVFKMDFDGEATAASAIFKADLAIARTSHQEMFC